MDKILSIKERILYYAESYGINKTELYSKLNVAASNFKGIGLKSEIGGDKIVKFLTLYPNVNPGWLLTGKGSMTKDTGEGIDIMNNSSVEYKEDIKGIPLMPIDAFAGLSRGEINVMDYECDRYLIPGCEKCDFLMPVKGDSMVPLYGSGDIVGCKMVPLKDIFFQWNKVYVLDTSQGALIKRVEKGADADHILLVSDNESYGPFELSLDRINAIALVLCLIKHV
jgi:repressor LexA